MASGAGRILTWWLESSAHFSFFEEPDAFADAVAGFVADAP